MLKHIRVLVLVLAMSPLVFAAESFAGYVANNGYYACVSQGDLDRLLAAIGQKRDEGPFNELMVSGRCTPLAAGAPVQLISPSSLPADKTGKVEIRLEGSQKSLWTIPEAIGQK